MCWYLTCFKFWLTINGSSLNCHIFFSMDILTFFLSVSHINKNFCFLQSNSLQCRKLLGSQLIIWFVSYPWLISANLPSRELRTTNTFDRWKIFKKGEVELEEQRPSSKNGYIYGAKCVWYPKNKWFNYLNFW